MRNYYTNRENPVKQTNFIENIFQLSASSYGIDLGCGDGKHLSLLRKISTRIYGVDKVDKENEFIKSIDFFEEEIQINNLDFAYCISPYFGTNWWRIESFFKNINNSLRKNGLFLIDLFEFNSYPDDYKWSESYISEGVEVEVKYKKTKDRVIAQKIINNSTVKWLVWRVFDKEEFYKIANDVGFEREQEYFDFDSNIHGTWDEQLTPKRLQILLKKS